MNMMKKKRAFTLIEILISFSLLSLILIIFFSCLTQTTLLSKKIQTAQAAVSQNNYLHKRLTSIFSKLIEKPTVKENSLSFIFDNGIDPDPLFHKAIKGRLFVENATLFLETEGNGPSTTPKRLEKLIEGIESSIDFSPFEKEIPLFFVLPLQKQNGQTLEFPFRVGIDQEGISFKEQEPCTFSP